MDAKFQNNPKHNYRYFDDFEVNLQIWMIVGTLQKYNNILVTP